MKIKVSIVESDKNYLERIIDAISVKYADKLDVYAYTSLEELKNDEKEYADVYLISDRYVFERREFSEKSILIYFVESKVIERVRGERAISKYQKPDDIYKEIFDLYAENAGIVVKESHSESNTQIYVFASATGGCGKTTLAVSTAYKMAMKGKKVLFASLEVFGSTDVFFERSKTGDLGNIIYNIKSKKNNISMKAESMIVQDFSGISYISSAENPYDIVSMTKEDMEIFINEIVALNRYEYIILDTDIGLGELLAEVLYAATKIVYITENNKSSEYKQNIFLRTMHLYEHRDSKPIISKIVKIINKSKKGQKSVNSSDEVICIGDVEFTVAEEGQLIEILSKSQALEKLFS